MEKEAGRPRGRVCCRDRGTVSWAVAVDQVPAENRPYIGGSDTNSVLELAFGYNGIARLKGMGRDGGGAPGGPPPDRQMQQDESTRPGGQGTAQYQDNSTNNQQQIAGDGVYPSGLPQMPPDGNKTANPQQIAQAGTNMVDQGQMQAAGVNMTDNPQMPPGDRWWLIRK